jgi:hypothetical protein
MCAAANQIGYQIGYSIIPSPIASMARYYHAGP